MNILSIIDSFKGTITSIELSKIIKKELEDLGHTVKAIAISDGGDGFLDVFMSNFNCDDYERINIKIRDPLFRIIDSFYIYNKKNNYAIIELAKASGVDLITQEELNPFITSSFGFGEMILDAIKRGITNIVVGIGGSATNDGGTGMLEALKVKFYDNSNSLLKHMNNDKLKSIDRIDTNEFNELIKNIKIIVCSDVINPLLGELGATNVYSIQKGARINDLEELENNMKNYARFNIDAINEMGSGAAGGVGYAFHTYFGDIDFVSGIDYILDMLEYEKVIKDVDLIISGEGKIDTQSLQGKVINKVINRSTNKKIILLCGINDIKEKIRYENVRIYSVVGDDCTKEGSLKNPQKEFIKLIRKVFKNEKNFND